MHMPARVLMRLANTTKIWWSILDYRVVSEGQRARSTRSSAYSIAWKRYQRRHLPMVVFELYRTLVHLNGSEEDLACVTVYICPDLCCAISSILCLTIAATILPLNRIPIVWISMIKSGKGSRRSAKQILTVAFLSMLKQPSWNII